MKSIKLIVFAFLLSAVTGCTSLTKKGQEAFDKGQYQSAADYFGRALAKDGKDEDARAGLTKARQHLIDDSLIQVRELRLAGNYQAALDKLTQITINEKNWNVAPSGVAFSTQTDEIENLFAWLTKSIHQEIKNARYLKARVMLSKYNTVFGLSDSSTERHDQALAGEVNAAGLRHCESLKSNAAGPFAQEFINRYCMVWGDKNSRATPAVKAEVQRYGSIALAGAIESLSPETAQVLGASLLKGLQSTPYYLAGAPQLKIQLSGKYADSYTEKPIILTHVYQVQIPYQVMVDVPYYESVPYTTYNTVVDPNSGAVSSVPVTQYRSETRYRQELQTNYRTEDRSFPYSATEFTVSYNLAAKIHYVLDGVTYDLPLQDAYRLTDNYHEMGDANIGLMPKQRTMMDEHVWLNGEFASVAGLLTTKVADAWDSKYCQVPKNLSAANQIESVMRCLKGSSKPHDFVENWFQSQFGLSMNEVKAAIGFGV